MQRRPPKSTLSSSSAASDVYKRQVSTQSTWAAKDQTILVRTLLKLIKRAKLANTELELMNVVSLIEDGFDKDESLSGFDQSIEKSKLEKTNRSSSKLINRSAAFKNQSRDREKERERIYQQRRAQRYQALLETELLYSEYIEIIFRYIYRKIKPDKSSALLSQHDSRSHQRQHDKKNTIGGSIEEKMNNCFKAFIQENSNIKILEDNIQWPQTEKDEEVQKLKDYRIREKIKKEQFELKMREIAKEENERLLMLQEDIRIPSDNDDESYYDSELESDYY
eukprot:TRINITY_DN12165_c0_g1_i2.p1 TRINITY_DN12165_c0_g1~~TRINITY_DN12165_c0_g1_i2.p1  ORF type:complete len:280 (+),score=60.09 TRINITY_DN12165_c0_g1_i2:54-893(+)